MNRDDFPMLKKDIIYFDNGATSLKPQCVIDKMTDYYENYSANAHRGDYDISYNTDAAGNLYNRSPAFRPYWPCIKKERK